MGIYFIAAGASSKNRVKSLDKPHKVTDISKYLSQENIIKLKHYFDEHEPIYLWGANELKHKELSKVKQGEYVVDVKNSDVIQIFRYCFYVETSNQALQNYIGWDYEKPAHLRRPYKYVFFLKSPLNTTRKDKSYFQEAFDQTHNQNWLVGQKYFSDSAVKLAFSKKNLSSIEGLLGIDAKAAVLKPISLSNKVLLKSVGISQHQDGVRIDKQFHDVFNPPNSPEYVPRGKARKIRVEFNGKTFDAEYRYEGTKARERDLQRIQFFKELKDEFKAVFPQAKGFFTIRLGNDLNHFIFSYETQGAQEYTDTLEEGIDKAKKDSSASRQARLATAQQRPDTVQVTSVAYIRNADVIVEVLDRASGICEKCKQNAPFKRKKDGTPYLEVHHRIPLSEGGFDTVENAIAVCPNCHRELHYG